MSSNSFLFFLFRILITGVLFNAALTIVKVDSVGGTSAILAPEAPAEDRLVTFNLPEPSSGITSLLAGNRLLAESSQAEPLQPAAVRPACTPNALVILAAADNEAMNRSIGEIEKVGGCALHVFPPHALIGSLPAEADLAALKAAGVSAVFNAMVEEQSLADQPVEVQTAARIWNMNFNNPAPAAPPAQRGEPLVNDQRSGPPPSVPDRAPALNSPAPGYTQVSSFMAGKVAVGIILPESNGFTDPSTENWSVARINTVISEIQAAMGWWSAQNPGGGLSFYYDIHTQVPTSYEPISRSSNEDGLWMSQALSSLGYTNPGWSTQAYDYINAMRSRLGTDWGVLIFVVDSLNDGDGTFTDGYFAYTYGYAIVMTYDNDGWGIENMDSVTAHEFAHNFGADDEYCSPGYYCCSGGGQVGYLGIANENCEAGCDNNHNGVCDGNDSGGASCNDCPTCVQASCLMRTGSVSSGLDTPSRQQVGIRDTDGDGILDPIDNIPALTFIPYPPDTTSDVTPTWTGSVTDIPWNSPTQKDVSINHITAVRYRIDGGDWADCVPGNGAFNETTETFSCTPAALSEGSHTIEVQAANRVGNRSNIASSTLTVNSHLPPANFQKTRPANGGEDYSTNTHLWWETSPDATEYEYCIDTVNNTTCEGEWTSTGAANHAEINGLHPNRTYYWQVRARNANAETYADDGAWWAFTTGSGVVSILLVDDDNNSPDVRSAYAGALTELNLPYHVWDTNRSDNEPGLADLSDYSSAIWFTGENWDEAAGPGPAGEASLATWLDTGKCLLISSRDYFYNRDLTPFMSGYLGIASVGGDAGDYTSVTGQGPFSGLGPYALTSNTYVDMLIPSTDSVTGWRGNNGSSAGVARDSGVYHTSFLGFQFEAIENASDRQSVLTRFLESCPSVGFIKTSPGNGLAVLLNPVVITWEASSGATGYEYCVDTSEICGGDWINAGATTSAILPGLNPLTTYYWQVRARNGAGEIYANSDTWWRFTVGLPLYLPVVMK